MTDMPVKYQRPTGSRWAVWKWCDIPARNDRTTVYLRRLRVINTPWFGVMVHWINEPDDGDWPHDHPWNFYSFVLRGGYHEDVYPDWHSWKERKPTALFHGQFSGHRMPLPSAHKITRVSDGLVTLVFAGRRQRVFRFWTDDKPVTWHKVLPKEVDDAG